MRTLEEIQTNIKLYTNDIKVSKTGITDHLAYLSNPNISAIGTRKTAYGVVLDIDHDIGSLQLIHDYLRRIRQCNRILKDLKFELNETKRFISKKAKARKLTLAQKPTKVVDIEYTDFLELI